MKKIIFLFLSPLSLYSLAQSDSCFTAKIGGDTFVMERPGYENNNYGNYKDLLANAWTYSGSSTITRSLMNFDYEIPSDAIIDSAKLSLYYHISPHGNGDHSGANAAYIQRITSAWAENTVSWNSQPSSSSINQVYLNQSTSGTQNYLDINVTDIVQDIQNAGDNYGFMLRLETEAIYSRLVFASKEEPNENLHPKLEVCYSRNVGNIELTVDEDFSVYPNPSNGTFSLEGSNLKNLVVYDANGKILLRQKISNYKTEVNLQRLEGVYNMLVEDLSGNWHTKRIIIF